MKGVSRDGDGSGSTNSIMDFNRSGDSSTNDSFFDASHYAFFGGKDVVEEVELGELEDDGVLDKTGLKWLDDLEYPFSFTTNEEIEEGRVLESLSDIDDLTSTFNKLNRVVAQPRSAGVIGDRGSSSRGSSSTLDWSQETDTSENVKDNIRWWSHPSIFPDSKPLNRTSSYPQPLPQQHHSIKPNPLPNSSLNYPSPIGTRPQPLLRHSSLPFYPNRLQLSGSSPCSGNIPQYCPTSPVSDRNRNQWLNQGSPFSLENPNLYPDMLQQHSSLPNGWENPSLLSNSLHQQLSLPNELYASHLLSQQRSYQAQQFSHLQSRFISPHPSTQRNKPSRKGRQNTRFSQQNSDTSSQNSDTMSMAPQFRSKYMSAEEIGAILKLQHSSTHKNDPYTNDYYHQACSAKKTTITKPSNQFHPSSIKDPPSKSRSNNSGDQNSFLQLDQSGRLSISSIRKLYPLLEPDPPSISTEGKAPSKPLEKEPMLAARAAIEEGFSLLLDIDDIDRFLQSGKTQDGGTHLRRRRQILLEALAASLQLVDPFNHSTGPLPKDDIIFLRLTSLPKGRKLITRLLQLLYPGSELTRIVCMAIFRHLRFLFGGLSADSTAADLSKTVAISAHKMDLGALSACLAAVVCSSEQPPLRPLGGSSGDGASVVIKSVLGRAGDIISAHAAANTTSYSPPNLPLWRASFDAFFALLTKYCLSKHESIARGMAAGPAAGKEMGEAVAREMPVELLRSSIPHTNGLQRQQLLDFAERFLPAAGYSGRGDVKGSMTSESVPG